MHHRDLFALLIVVLLVGLSRQIHAADITADAASLGRWQSLWDGKTFTGWHIIGKGNWRIENGAIVGRHKAQEAEFGHLVSNATYRDFVLRVKYKAIKGNSGLYFRVEEKGFSGVSGFQAEIDPNHDAGGLYETNGRAWVVQPKPEDVKKWYRPNEWNEMTVTALGRNVVVHVNGTKSAEITNDPGRLEGHIALQIHGSQDCEVMFKDIEIIPFQSLFRGSDLSVWRKPLGEWMLVGDAIKDANNERALVTKPGTGILINGPKGNTSNLFTQLEHGDVIAHIEFMIPKGSNSGVYFQGRYEVQIYDSFGVGKDKYPGIECGGIYPRWIDDREVEGHSPRVNASLPPGQWQTFDVIFRAPRFDSTGKKTANAKFVKVIHNGQVVHENVEVTGPTRAAAFEDEKPLGPIMFQGDHGPIAYRNICILPLSR